MSEELTSSALLEQLVYIDNYINGTQPNTDSSTATPNIDVDGQLSLDLAAFADDSFIFPDEDKPKPLYDHEDDGEDDGEEEDVDEIGQAEGVRRRIGDKKRNKDANFASSGNNDGLNGWNIHEFNSSNLVPTIKQEPEVGSSHLYFRNLNGEDDDGHEDRLNEFNLLLSHANNGDTGLPHGLMDAFHNSSNKNITNGKNNDVHGHDLDTQHQHHHHRHVQPHKLLSLNELPKFPVPPGAKNSLVSAGLSLNQIDLLSALIAQHQTNLGKTISQQQHRGSAGEPNDDGDLGVETINSFMVTTTTTTTTGTSIININVIELAIKHGSNYSKRSSITITSRCSNTPTKRFISTSLTREPTCILIIINSNSSSSTNQFRFTTTNKIT